MKHFIFISLSFYSFYIQTIMYKTLENYFVRQ